jgi:ribose/xylose/arabinose/galactoside ABC-type transport system permease subunit
LFITLLNNALNLLGVGWYTMMIVLGGLILLSAITSYLLKGRAGWKWKKGETADV